MTDITELAQSLKAAAEQATPGNWRAFRFDTGHCGVAGGLEHDTMVCEHISKDRPQDALFIALTNPANVLALVEALEKAQKAININNQWKPDACPITGRRFFLWIEHPELGYVPTYGGPYDSYTIPTRDSDGEFSCERYDHDVGGWVDGECVGAYLIDDDEQSRVYELEKRIAELERQNSVLADGVLQAEKWLLESRTVKLPQRYDLIGETDGNCSLNDAEMAPDNDGVYLRVRDVREMLTAAGIKWEAE